MTVLITRRNRNGEALGEYECEPTGTPGLWIFQSLDECECNDCDEGWDCQAGPTYSWYLICEAGVVVSWFGHDKPTALRLARDLAAVGVDFSLPFEQVVEAARAPAAREAAARALVLVSSADPEAAS